MQVFPKRFYKILGLSQNVLLKNTDRNVCATETSICQPCSGTGILACEVCENPKSISFRCMHHLVTTILTLLGLIALFSVIAQRLTLPQPIFLVIVGLLLSVLLGIVPSLPAIHLDPQLVFLVFLPPILYAAAWNTSWRDFKANLEPISILAFGMVLLTTLVTAYVAHTFIPGMSWATAAVLGAIISPPDAAAATAITQRLGLPGRITTILEGESLVNDASGLVAYKFAVAAVVAGTFSLAEAGLSFVAVLLGGAAVGLALAWCVVKIHSLLDLDDAVDIAITILTPFLSYLLAEAVHVSGVIAVVATGVYVGRQAPLIHSAKMRVSAIAVWEFLIFLLNGFIFIIIGLNLPTVIHNLSPRYTAQELAFYALVVNVASILVRLIGVFATDALSALVKHLLAPFATRFMKRRSQQHSPDTASTQRSWKEYKLLSWKEALIIGWTGMRGIVSLAAALALPYVSESGAAFPHRDLILFLSFTVILCTLVVQGFTLPTLIRSLKVGSDEADCREHEKEVRLQAINAAQKYIAEKQVSMQLPEFVMNYVQATHDHRILHLDHTSSENEIAQLSIRLNREALAVERAAVIAFRNEGRISDEVLHRIQHDLDIEELRLPEVAAKG